METKPCIGDVMIIHDPKGLKKIILTAYRIKKLIYNKEEGWKLPGNDNPLSFYSPSDYVDLSDGRVQEALSFMKELIAFCLEKQSYLYIPSSYQEKPWIHYVPARTDEEKKEREDLIQKYGRAEPHQIQYYLLYHHCRRLLNSKEEYKFL